MQDQETARPSDRYRNPRGGPNARHHGPDVPDDVGADEARARADSRPARRSRSAAREGEALENVPRSAADAGHDVQVSGALVTDRAQMSERRALLKGLVGAALPKGSDPLTRRGQPAYGAAARRVARALLAASSCCRSGARRPSARSRDASVLVVGAGALGSPVATYLAGAGVGRLGIVDDGDVEVSNLHRQHLHFTPDVGVPKAHSAVVQARLPQPRHRDRAVPGGVQRRRCSRAGPRRRLHRRVRHPLRGQRRLLRGGHRRWWRAASSA